MIRPNASLIGGVALVVAVVALAGCGGHSNLKVQPTAGTDFSKYRTYAIKPGNVVYPGAGEAERAEMEQRVQDAVARSLESRGLVPQPEQPDLVVTYTLGARSQGGLATGGRAPVGVDAREPSGNPYDEPGLVRAQEWSDAAADADLRARNVGGNLVIDLLDGKARSLVWRATAELDLAPSKRARTIDEVVERAFAELPTLRASAPKIPRMVPEPDPSTMPSTAPVEPRE